MIMADAPLIRARSVSGRVAGILQRGTAGRVLASFERACTLVTDEGEIAALTWNGVGNGPLNVVIEAQPCPTLSVGTRFAVSSGSEMLSLQNHFDGASILRVDLSGAVEWNPRPDWPVLRSQRRHIVANAEAVADVARRFGYCTLSATVQSRLKQAQKEFCAAYCSQDQKALKLAIGGLCGAGEGLTPAGDDWLAGWLLALWLIDLSDSSLQAVKPGSASPRLKPRIHGDWWRFPGQGPWGVGSIGSLITEIARQRTTLLSQALLACAAAGEADESWHTLLQELARHHQDVAAITRATRRILSHGATSGAAMVSGFLAGLRQDASLPETWSER